MGCVMSVKGGTLVVAIIVVVLLYEGKDLIACDYEQYFLGNFVEKKIWLRKMAQYYSFFLKVIITTEIEWKLLMKVYYFLCIGSKERLDMKSSKLLSCRSMINK